MHQGAGGGRQGYAQAHALPDAERREDDPELRRALHDPGTGGQGSERSATPRQSEWVHTGYSAYLSRLPSQGLDTRVEIRFIVYIPTEFLQIVPDTLL